MTPILSSAKPVLVTGAGGLVGGSVVTQLASRGEHVVGLDKFPSSVAGVEIVECDLRDIRRLYGIVHKANAGAIIHCGGYSGPMLGRENPHDMIEVNVTGTANLLELARLTGMRRFVYCSSMSVYGSTTAGPVDEHSYLEPATVYGATKLAAEQLVIAYARDHGLDTAALRLSWIYGPNRKTTCILRQMIDDALHGKPTTQSWGADFPRQYIHSDDAARALLAALDSQGLKKRVYNITGESRVTLGELSDLVRQSLPDADIMLGPGPAPDDDYHHEFNTSAARAELGFRPHIPLSNGVADMVTELRRRLERGAFQC